MTASLSIIVPTTGRATLARTLASITAQVTKDDRVIVVADLAKAKRTWGDIVKKAARRTPCRWSLVAVNGGDYGYTARTKGISHADTTHLAFIDDDDIYLPGAFTAMRREAGDVPAIFRMEHPVYQPIWAIPEIRFANVGTPMFVVPNKPELLGEWSAHVQGTGGDYTFIKGCCERMGDPTWHEQAIARVRPEAWPRRSRSTA